MLCYPLVIGKAAMKDKKTKPLDIEKALQKSEMRFKSIVNASPMGIHMYELTEDGELIFSGSNPAAQRILGVDHALFIGKKIEEAFPSLVSTNVPAHYKAVARDGQPWKTEQIEYAGGEIRGVFEVFAFQTEPGKMAALFNDISKRKRAEEKVRQLNSHLEQKNRDLLNEIQERVKAQQAAQNYLERLQIATRAARIGIWDWNVVDNILIWDDTIYEIYGMPDGFFKGGVEEWSTYIHPDDRARVLNELQASLRGECEYAPEFRIIWPDGSIHDIKANSQVFWGENKEPVRMVGSNIDITERKRVVEALRDSEYFFKESQHAANIGSYKLNFLTGAWEASEVLFSLFGIDRDYPKTIEGWLALVYRDDRPMMDQYLKEEVIAKRNPFDKEYRIVRKSDGAVRWIRGLGKIAFDQNDQLVTMTGTILDITDRKHAEIEREKLLAQLIQAQKMESVGRLAGGVAHDFNNMLGVILGYTELAMEKVPPLDPLHADLEEIQTAAQRSADLTRQLLAFASKQTVAPKTLDLNDTVERMLKILRRLIGENITLAWKPGHGLWSIRMDPTQIDQMLANLCVNARDAISGAGKVTIETANASFDEEDCAHHLDFLPGDYVLLAVSDNGCGMSPESISHLFEPFFTTKEVGKGTGLGLASMYGAIKQNKGFINVYSELGKGTTFKIYLPRDTSQSQAEPAESHPQVERGNETILLVEDEPAILRMTGVILEKLGYNVLAASSPSEALRLAQEHKGPISLLLTDVIMPEMQGYELAKNLQALYPTMKCLFMSGYTAHSIVNSDPLAKEMHFIQKPFSKMDLASKLREVLKK
jgi:PAS domain S-box-containing protein